MTVVEMKWLADKMSVQPSPNGSRLGRCVRSTRRLHCGEGGGEEGHETCRGCFYKIIIMGNGGKMVS